MTADPPERRPPPGPELSGAELLRWYWLKAELMELARSLGTSPSGSKADLTARVAAVLDGHPVPEPSPDRVRAERQLAAPLTDATVIPRGQRSSQALRTYFADRIDPSFRFDAPMRTFVADGAGRTLSEAVDHWHSTRGARTTEIGAQFELNRFTRSWYEDHPGGARADLLADWRRHRSLPVDRRDRP